MLWELGRGLGMVPALGCGMWDAGWSCAHPDWVGRVLCLGNVRTVEFLSVLGAEGSGNCLSPAKLNAGMCCGSGGA